MPTVIANVHDILIARLVISGREKIIRKYRLATGKSKE